MLEFFDTEMQSGTAAIYENHITFNKNLLKYFHDAYKVRIGIDKAEKKIYAFLINKDYAESGEIKQSSLLSLSVSKTYARVCSRAMVDYVCKEFDLNIPKKEYLRYEASYDEKKRALIINVGGGAK